MIYEDLLREKLAIEESVKPFLILDRPLTWDEYKKLKTAEWRTQSKIFVTHLGKAGWEKYRGPIPAGEKSKYPLYKKLYLEYNSKLGRALR